MKRAACALAAWAVLLVATAARADVGASCVAERTGERAQARLVLTQLFDDELLHLVRLGLRGQIHVEVTLFRRRRFWFDQRRASETLDVVAAWSRGARALTVAGRPVPDPTALTLFPPSLRPLGSGSHYLEISARLEVVTTESLGQMAGWLLQGDERSAIGRSLLSYVAAGLVRTASARCPVQ
jgi:hypothetical protein